MESRKINRVKLVELSGVPRRTLYDALTASHAFSVDVLGKLAEGLGVSPAELVK